MPDISHVFGADLTFGPTGDLARVDGSELTTQRALRRLLTNPLDSLWQPEYGAGLPAMVGHPAEPLRITAIVRRQLAMEEAIAAVPPPTVTVDGSPDGTVTARISYTDAPSGATQSISVPLGG